MCVIHMCLYVKFVCEHSSVVGNVCVLFNRLYVLLYDEYVSFSLLKTIVDNNGKYLKIFKPYDYSSSNIF